jgi:hypothetical protein
MYEPTPPDFSYADMPSPTKRAPSTKVAEAVVKQMLRDDLMESGLLKSSVPWMAPSWD